MYLHAFSREEVLGAAGKALVTPTARPLEGVIGQDERRKVEFRISNTNKQQRKSSLVHLYAVCLIGQDTARAVSPPPPSLLAILPPGSRGKIASWIGVGKRVGVWEGRGRERGRERRNAHKIGRIHLRTD